MVLKVVGSRPIFHPKTSSVTGEVFLCLHLKVNTNKKAISLSTWPFNINQVDYLPLLIKSRESELTQCRVFFLVKPSPEKTWPKWPPHFAQVISVRFPSLSIVRFTAPGISLSNEGHPHPESNLSSDRKSGVLQWRQTYNPFSECL